jgi:hypothetical protein
MEESQMADISRIRGFIYGNWQTCITYAFAELDVAEWLERGMKSLESLAEAVKVEPNTLFRFLRCCAQLNFIEIEAETKTISLTGLGRYLLKDHPQSQRDAALLNGVFFRYEPWGKIVDVLRSGGGEGFSETYRNGSLHFLKDKPALLEMFQRAMTNLSVTENEQIAKAYDFSRFSHIIDVGGGQGTFLLAVLDANRAMRGTLFDLEESLATVILPEGNDRKRICLTQGDFFDSIPSDGDVYTMKNVLHNWPPEKVKMIMKNLYLAIKNSECPEQKRVLVIEHVMNDECGTESITPWMDMNFFILVGGQDRTLNEYSQLFSDCGFSILNVISTKTGRSIIELSICPA